MKKRIAFPIVKVTTKVVVLKQVKVKAYTRTHCFPPWFLSDCILPSIGLTQGFSSMNLTTFRKSFQRFNNSIPAGVTLDNIYVGSLCLIMSPLGRV